MPKRAIVTFVDRVTQEGSLDFVPGPERIAVFDNDGTLWTTAEFEKIVTDWITTAKHPTTGRPYTGMVYQPMLEWTTAGKGPRFGLLVHHDDADREWAYDRQSHIGRLDHGLDEGPKRGWTIVSMKSDWKSVYPVTAK